MSLQGEIITAFVAALGTIGTTVGLVAYLLRDLRSEIGELRTGTRSEFASVRSEIASVRSQHSSEIGGLRSEIGGVRSEIGSVRSEVQELRTEMRSEMAGLRGDVRQVLVELLHHVQSGHHPPPQAA